MNGRWSCSTAIKTSQNKNCPFSRVEFATQHSSCFHSAALLSNKSFCQNPWIQIEQKSVLLLSAVGLALCQNFQTHCIAAAFYIHQKNKWMTGNSVQAARWEERELKRCLFFCWYLVKMFVQNNYTSHAHILLFNRFVILHTLSEQRFATYFITSE